VFVSEFNDAGSEAFCGRTWRRQKAASGLGLGNLKPEPPAYPPFNGGQLDLRRFAQSFEQFRVWDRNQTLSIEDARRRNGTATFTSNRDCRGLVVCGTSVAKARSASSAGMPMTSAGRTLAAMPRSTNYTGALPRTPARSLAGPLRPAPLPPNLAPLRGWHQERSRRSSSTKSRSAALIRSSSFGRSCGNKPARHRSSASNSARSVSGSASNSSRILSAALVMVSASHRILRESSRHGVRGKRPAITRRRSGKVLPMADARRNGVSARPDTV
jgi:hypothetical protein